MQILFNELRGKVKTAKSILFVSHCNPDPDTIGGALALGNYAEKQGVCAEYFCIDTIPQNFYFLAGVEKFKKNIEILKGNYDLVIFVDCSELARCGIKSILDYKKTFWINIDHHIDNERVADLTIRDSEASAVCEIIYDFLQGYGIDNFTATHLLAGILIDTNFLSNPGASAKTIKIAGELSSLGADYRKIIKNFYCNRTPEMLKIWGVVLSRLKYNEEKGLATTAIFKDDLRVIERRDAFRLKRERDAFRRPLQTNSEVRARERGFVGTAKRLSADKIEESLEGISNFLNAMLDAKIILVLRETKDGVKGSLRTNCDDIDVAQIASQHGGGGHKKAAGFRCKGEILEEEDEWRIKIS